MEAKLIGQVEGKNSGGLFQLTDDSPLNVWIKDDKVVAAGRTFDLAAALRLADLLRVAVGIIEAKNARPAELIIPVKVERNKITFLPLGMAASNNLPAPGPERGLDGETQNTANAAPWSRPDKARYEELVAQQPDFYNREFVRNRNPWTVFGGNTNAVTADDIAPQNIRCDGNMCSIADPPDPIGSNAAVPELDDVPGASASPYQRYVELANSVRDSKTPAPSNAERIAEIHAARASLMGVGLDVSLDSSADPPVSEVRSNVAVDVSDPAADPPGSTWRTRKPLA